LLEKFQLDFQTHLVGLYGGTMAADTAHLASAKLVPTPRMPGGTVVGESLAITKTSAKHHLDIAIWPATTANCAGNAPYNFDTSTRQQRV